MTILRETRSWRSAFLLLFASGFSLPAATSGQEFHVALERENQVRFTSEAPLEDFEGVTSRIDGFLFLSGGGLDGPTDLTTSEFYFEVDLGSLDTGIGLRNRHMRDNYLETNRFPFASFEGRVTALEKEGPGGYRATTSGTLAIHGVERNRQIECSASPAGEALRVRCGFTVALSDHDIPIPKLMFMKINEVMELDLDFFLMPAAGGEGR
ncbi:MAG: YceI family protein [Longimicrobiales bacterium]